MEQQNESNNKSDEQENVRDSEVTIPSPVIIF